MLNSAPRVPLASEFEVVVIGGGSTGVAIARECAKAGRRVLIVEKNDFGSGTTSRSTRIIHGGLRYIESGEFGMVREALVERDRLIRERPHLVRPKKFVFALPNTSRHSALELRLGLWLYKRLGGDRKPNRVPQTDLAYLERNLDNQRHWALFEYDDAQCEFPERIVAEWLVEAQYAGAVARNYTEVLEVPAREGRIRGVRLRDRLNQQEQHVRAEWVINATGPWADSVVQNSGLGIKRPLVGGVRGTHIVLPVFTGSPKTPLYTEAEDGRAVFLIPWNGNLLIGCTETPDSESPDEVEPSSGEVRYLLNLVNRLYPEAGLGVADVHYAFAGIRPLPFSDGKSQTAASRRYVVRNHAAEGALGLLSVIGGKLTTAAAVARRCARMIGLTQYAETPAAIAAADSADVESVFNHWAHMVSLASGISVSCARSLAEWHGTHALTIAKSVRQNPELRQPIADGTCHILAEAIDAVRNECAVTLADILLRRVPIALDPNFSEECAMTAAARIGSLLGWSDREIGQSLESFIEERAAFLRRPASMLPVVPAEHAA